MRIFIVFCITFFSFSGCKDRLLAPSGVSIKPVTSVQLTPIQGGKISELAQKSRQPLTVVNLWASWCYPCRQEFPELVEFYRKWNSKGVDLKFVSMDVRAEIADVLEFLKAQGVEFETFIKDENDDRFIKSMDSTWQGFLPTTYLYDQSGKIVARFDEPLTLAELESKISKFKR